MEPIIPNPDWPNYGQRGIFPLANIRILVDIDDHPMAKQTMARKQIFESLEEAEKNFSSKLMTKGWYIYN